MNDNEFFTYDENNNRKRRHRPLAHAEGMTAATYLLTACLMFEDIRKKKIKYLTKQDNHLLAQMAEACLTLSTQIKTQIEDEK